MEDFSKITKVLEALGYSNENTIKFIVRRFERLDHNHIKLAEKNKQKINEIFEKFHQRYDLKIKEGEFPSTIGVLSVKRFVEFLEEYDERFDLNWCEIDLKEITFKPIYL